MQQTPPLMRKEWSRDADQESSKMRRDTGRYKSCAVGYMVTTLLHDLTTPNEGVPTEAVTEMPFKHSPNCSE